MVQTAEQTIAGIGEMLLSNDPTQVLITYSLGSCLGVTVYDPQAQVGGIIHCMLPLSTQERNKPDFRPAKYVDSGVVALLQEAVAMGATQENLIIRVAGAGTPMDQCGRFKIGERNYAVLRKVLWKNNLMIAGEDIGGPEPKTMKLCMADGRTLIRKGREEAEL